MRVKQINYKIILNVSRSSEVVEFWVIDRKKLNMGAGILWAPSLYFVLLLAGAVYES